MKLKTTILFACLLLLNCVSYADSIILHNGTKLSGVVTEKDDLTVTIQIEQGRVLSYPLGDVLKIEYSGRNSEDTPDLNTPWNHEWTYPRYGNNNTGFWGSAEAFGASSIATNRRNIQLAEIDIYAGYRFSEFFRVGFGFGPRYYISNDNMRFSKTEWGMPIMFNLRGNLVPTGHSTIVPYYSFDFGGTVGDGLLFRPRLGIRFGEPRSPFLLSVSYLCQRLDCIGDELGQKESKFISFLGINLGYEF